MNSDLVLTVRRWWTAPWSEAAAHLTFLPFP